MNDDNEDFSWQDTDAVIGTSAGRDCRLQQSRW
jgi:hypothetical protein